MFRRAILGTALAVLTPTVWTSTSAPAFAAATDPYPSTYVARSHRPTLITHATVLTATGARIEDGSVLFADGKVVAVGRDLAAPPDALVIDARGKWVTPGIIDVHSHLGVYPSPEVQGNEDGNEATEPITADVFAEHSVWPQDPQFELALAGGVTSLLVLPGSANLIGGVGVVLKNVPGSSVQAMKFPGAPPSLKMACGENPKRVYGNKGRSPATRMGNLAVVRGAWIDAVEYRRKWQEYRTQLERSQKAPPKDFKGGAGENGNGERREVSAPTRDLELETLVRVLDGEILVQNHCYRADEMGVMIDLAKEFGYEIAAFHHAVESYKIAPWLAREKICSAMWADWWGFKMEAYDGIRENAAIVEAANACAIIHSDSAQGIQRLNQEAAKALAAGRRMALPTGARTLTEEDAIRWITVNPARAMGIAETTGTLEAGKAADLVLWSGNPFSVYSRAERVWIDGALQFDRAAARHHTDFELGLRDGGEK